MEFLNIFNELQVVLLFIAIIYGVMFGIGNTYVRFICIFSNRSMNQSELGTFLDMFFYIVITYLTYVYMGA